MDFCAQFYIRILEYSVSFLIENIVQFVQIGFSLVRPPARQIYRPACLGFGFV
nr:MAG TPA: hypothetical protein [Inoviridae sp.]